MPKSRTIHKNTSEQICEILKERSPELYEALEIEALKQIARATAEAVRRDDVQNMGKYKLSYKDGQSR